MEGFHFANLEIEYSAVDQEYFSEFNSKKLEKFHFDKNTGILKIIFFIF